MRCPLIPYPAPYTSASTSMAKRPSSAPKGPPLLSLPSPLLHLITSFLPISTKLASLTHLHPSFPPLTPSSFHPNTLHLTPSTFRAIDLQPPLLSLLSHIPRLTSHLDWDADEEFDANPRYPLAPSPLNCVASALPHLTSLHLSVTGDTAWVASLLHRLCASDGGAFPCVRTLRVEVRVVAEERVVLGWRGLGGGFPALRELRLDKVELDQASFARLCALPLRVLDLRCCALYALDHVPVSATAGLSASQVPVCKEWRSLLLPDSSAVYEPVLCRLLERYVDSVLAGEEGEGEGRKVAGESEDEAEADEGRFLTHLTYNARLALETLRLLASLRSLTSLDLSSCPAATNDISLASFYDPASFQPLLPRLRRFLHWSTLPLVHSFHKLQVASKLQSVYGAYLGFLSAYSAQLTVLELVVPQSVPFISVLLLQLLDCSSLFALKLVGKLFPASPARLEAASPPRPLLQLHSLCLQSVPLFVGEMGAFVLLCPALEDVELSNLPLCASDALHALAHGCPLLRRLRMLGCNGDTLRRRKETELNSCATLLTSSSSANLARSSSSSTLLPCLTFLQVTPTQLPPLLPLLASLPSLRYFDHAASTNYLPLENLHLLAALPHIAGVNCGRMELEGEMSYFFEGSGRSREDEDGDGGEGEAWGWRERVKGVLAMKGEFLRQCSTWRGFVEERRFAQRTNGREAFFRALQEADGDVLKVARSGRGGRVT